MNIFTESTDNYLYLRLDQDKLDATISAELKSWFVENITNTNTKNVIFDLAPARYCDSSGLSAILVGNRLCQEKGGIFVIANASDHINKLIRISQLDTVLNVLPSKEEAVDAVFLHEVETQLRSDENKEN